MAPTTEHHHRNTTKVSHKPFKSRHATKSLIRDLAKGKIEGTEAKPNRKTPHQQVMSKFGRKNQARQIRQTKHQQNIKSSSVFAGQNGAPRVIAVVPLCEDMDAVAAIQNLNQAVDAESLWPLEGHMRVRVDRFKQNLVYVPVQRDLMTALDACRLADFVVFLLSPTEEPGEEGELLLKTIEGQGVSNVLTMVQNLDNVEPARRRPQIVTSLKSYITHFFPNQEKVLSLDAESECSNAIRSLCTTTPKGVKWREDRSWMLVENLQWPSNVVEANIEGEVVVTGVVRGKGLQANRLVQIGEWGHFQIEKITDATLPSSKKRKADEMAVDEAKDEEVLEVPDVNQEELGELAPYEATMEDVDALSVSEAPTEKRGVLLDDHHYFSDDETHLPDGPKRLPKGTSSYQSAWFLGDMSDSGSDFEDAVDDEGDLDMEAPALPQDGLEGLDKAPLKEPTEATPSEYPQSEMFLDPSPDDEAAQLAEYRAQRKTEANEDLEFPDEIELHPNVLARERLARYRGLKSLRTSHWETSEDRAHEPEEWNRLLQVPDYKRAKKQVDNDALVGGVQPGKRVHVHLRSVPLSLQQTHIPTKPLVLYSFLRHEQKRTVVNYSITLNSNHPNPLRSKGELIMQCGPRRFFINPIFSQSGNTPNNVHKFLRYLHPGQTAIATFIAPITWGSVPAIFFQPSASMPGRPLALIATGTSLPASTSRIIAKRVILTGHPYKIHKKLVTVRYMFFNKEDVQWFKALQLWTKRGRSGFIKESLGTHGYFKATFDGKINPQDAVGVSLYKRVWPREARPWTEAEKIGESGEEEMPPNSQPSSTGTTTAPSTAKTSPKKPPSTPPTPFLRSRSQVRFALDSNFALDSDGDRRVPPLLPTTTTTKPATTTAQPNTPATNIHFSPNPNHCYRVVGAATREHPANVRFATDPNDCFRLSDRRIQLPARPSERERGESIPLRGQYVDVFGTEDAEAEDEDDDDDDASLGLDDDLLTGMRRFAWAYAKGVGGLVMGVVDGLAGGTR